MSNPYNSATERASILGPTLYFKGDLTAEEDLLIQGRVEGSITHTQRLTVGPQGTVKANIKAQLIIVEGTVDGDLAGREIRVREGNGEGLRQHFLRPPSASSKARISAAASTWTARRPASRRQVRCRFAPP